MPETPEDAALMTPAEISDMLRDESGGLFWPEGADCIDEQSAEITALRAERDGLIILVPRMHEEVRRLRAERDALDAELTEASECIVERDQKVCELTDEITALAARLAVPGELGALIRDLRILGDTLDLKSADALTALRARVAGLEGALTELTELFDDDGYLNVVGDYQREVVAAARAALSPSAAQEARDAD